MSFTRPFTNHSYVGEAIWSGVAEPQECRLPLRLLAPPAATPPTATSTHTSTMDIDSQPQGEGQEDPHFAPDGMKIKQVLCVCVLKSISR